MENFILLHRTKVSVNNKPSFDEILVNVSEIISVEPSTHNGCNAEVFLKTDTGFHPLYCKESFDAIINLLKDKGITIISF